eukprot:scaffold1827_cov421-Prasinococcus_capsulatus_cf.AAC.39
MGAGLALRTADRSTKHMHALANGRCCAKSVRAAACSRQVRVIDVAYQPGVSSTCHWRAGARHGRGPVAVSLRRCGPTAELRCNVKNVEAVVRPSPHSSAPPTSACQDVPGPSGGSRLYRAGPARRPGL